MEVKENSVSPLVFDNTQKQQIESLVHGLNDHQLSWLAGYLTGIGQSAKFITNPSVGALQNNGDTPKTQTNILEATVLFGSRTGNGLSIAKKIKKRAEAQGIQINFCDLNDYPLKKLKDEKNLFVIVSTHGEGEPPVSAEEFYNLLFSKRAPKLDGVNFSVLALGDKSYIHFCKTGRDIDQKLEALGAKRIYARVDCDIEFNDDAEQWIDGLLSEFLQINKSNISISLSNNAPSTIEDESPEYNRQNPYKSAILDKIKLSGRGSQKEIYHYELSLENSGITYEPGDSVGIYPTNSQRLVNEFASELHLNMLESVQLKNHTVRLNDALTSRIELSVISPEVLNAYNQFAESKVLADVIADKEKLAAFIYGRDMVDLVKEFPTQLSTDQLLTVLKKVQPRLYSISSSNKAFEDELHLTISAVRYQNTRYKEGVCSTFLSDRVTENESLLIYLERNFDFRLPKDANAPVIMVGPGTGIAPFRAFLQERETIGATGKNWLFFGDQHFETDFLYQTEIQKWHKDKLLTNLSLAFSRDTEHKTYVQHKMEQSAKELFDWIENGAYFYICGDAKRMGADVHQTLINIISTQKNISSENAIEYLHQLKKEKRYQTDVY